MLARIKEWLLARKAKRLESARRRGYAAASAQLASGASPDFLESCIDVFSILDSDADTSFDKGWLEACDDWRAKWQSA